MFWPIGVRLAISGKPAMWKGTLLLHFVSNLTSNGKTTKSHPCVKGTQIYNVPFKLHVSLNVKLREKE